MFIQEDKNCKVFTNEHGIVYLRRVQVDDKGKKYVMWMGATKYTMTDTRFVIEKDLEDAYQCLIHDSEPIWLNDERVKQ